MLYVAVAIRENCPSYRSGGNNGGWSAFTGLDRQEVIERALKYSREATERNSSGSGTKFIVYVGTLTHTAQQPITYELIPIKDGE